MVMFAVSVIAQSPVMCAWHVMKNMCRTRGGLLLFLFMTSCYLVDVILNVFALLAAVVPYREFLALYATQLYFCQLLELKFPRSSTVLVTGYVLSVVHVIHENAWLL